MRVRHPTERVLEHKAEWLELFYDLVLVAALSSSNHAFVVAPTIGHAVVAMLAILGLFLLWLLTTLMHNRFMVDGIIYRSLLLIQMMGLLIAAIAANPNDDISWQYSLTSYALALATVGLMFALAPVMIGRPVPGVWIAALGCLLAAGICLITVLLPEWVSSWAMVLAILLSLGPVAYYFARRASTTFPLHADHLRERLGLLVLIVIGEGFLQLLNSAHDKGSDVDIRFFLLVFLFNFALGAAYFDGVFTKGKDSDSRLWGATVLAHFFLIVGIIIGSDELAIFAGVDPEASVDSGGVLFAVAVSLIFLSLGALDAISHHCVTRNALVLVALGLLMLIYGTLAAQLHAMDPRFEVIVISMVLVIYSFAFAWRERRASFSQSPL